jgi:hypothetical protein
MPNENGNHEVLEAIKTIGLQVQENSEAIHTLSNQMDERFSETRQEFREVRHEIRQVDERVMLVNDKVDLLAVKLMDKEVITKTDAAEIMRFEAN